MNLSIRKPWILLPLLVVAMSLQQCSCADIIGPLFVSEDDEEKLGAEFNQQLLAKTDSFPVFATNGNASRAAMQAYLTGIFQSVHDNIPESDRPGYFNRFHFTIIDADVENAFAVPGGYVYVYTGILKSIKTESEIAGVLGHEMAHVTRHHYRDALAQQVGIQTLISAISGGGGELTQLVAGIFGDMLNLKVSRENEAEADDYGTRYLGATGRHPMGIAEFFARMKSSGVAWLSTHPDPADRVKSVTDEVNADPNLKKLLLDELRYQTRYHDAVCNAAASKIKYCPD